MPLVARVGRGVSQLGDLEGCFVPACAGATYSVNSLVDAWTVHPRVWGVKNYAPPKRGVGLGIDNHEDSRCRP